MADLPTNYLDDILAVSMGGKRKFKITHENGSTEEVTIEDISDYDQVGSAFGAGDINQTNQAVNEKFDSGDVVDPMLTTEEGFAADAYKTKLQFDEQNKNKADKYIGEGSVTTNHVGEFSVVIPEQFHGKDFVVFGNSIDDATMRVNVNPFADNTQIYGKLYDYNNNTIVNRSFVLRYIILM